MPSEAKQSYIVALAEQFECVWPSIMRARNESERTRQKLEILFQSGGSPDTSVVVFGSIARQEVTKSSDVDWILLIDGQSLPEH